MSTESESDSKLELDSDSGLEFPGGWRRLTKSYRKQGNIYKFSCAFAEKFLPDQFPYLPMESESEQLDLFQSCKNPKFYYKEIDYNDLESEILKLEKSFLSEKPNEKIHPNERIYLSFQKETLKDVLPIIESCLRETSIFQEFS